MNKKEPPHNFSGIWVYDCPAGTRTETEYVNGVQHGAYKHKNSSGIVSREGYKENGNDHGPVTIRNSSGNIISTYTFVNGTGTHQIFNSNDELGYEIPYKNGLLHGSKRHFINGKVVSEQIFKLGKEI